MALKEKIVFIINPIAGTKSKRVMREVIESYLDDQKFIAHTAFTERAGHASQLVQEHISQGYRYVVAVGGDGTVNEVASSLIDREAVLGIVPFGSGNGLARHLNIPLRPKGAIETINGQREITIDAGLANGRAFFCTAGIGFDAHVGQLFSRSKTRGSTPMSRRYCKSLLIINPCTTTSLPMVIG